MTCVYCVTGHVASQLLAGSNLLGGTFSMSYSAMALVLLRKTKKLCTVFLRDAHPVQRRRGPPGRGVSPSRTLADADGRRAKLLSNVSENS